VMASVVVVLFRPPDFTTNARHHKCLIFSKCSVSPTDFAEEANKCMDASFGGSKVVIPTAKLMEVGQGGAVVPSGREEKST
jgi:hypothetical protein